MATVIKDLPADIKEKFIKELSTLNYSLVGDKPIGSGVFGYVYMAEAKSSGLLVAFKVIQIPSKIYYRERELLMRFISEEVNIY